MISLTFSGYVAENKQLYGVTLRFFK